MAKGKKYARPDEIDPKHRWDWPLQAPGRTQVDFDKLTRYSLLISRLTSLREPIELYPAEELPIANPH